MMFLAARSVYRSTKRVQGALGLLLMRANGVDLGKGIRMRGLPFVINRGAIAIGDGVKLNSGPRHNPVGSESRLILVAGTGAEIRIEPGAGLSNCHINARSSVHVGAHAYIGGGVMIVDHDFHSLRAEFRELEDDPDVAVAPVRIGDHTFLGARSIVLKGVEIGEHAVVGAGAVVTRSVPAGEIWGGNPAKRIGTVPGWLEGVAVPKRAE